jgi:hypothetical protein
MFSQTNPKKKKKSINPCPRFILKNLDATGFGIWIGWVYLLKMQGLGKNRIRRSDGIQIVSCIRLYVVQVLVFMNQGRGNNEHSMLPTVVEAKIGGVGTQS